MTAKELTERLRANGVARVEGVADPDLLGQNAVQFLGPDGEVLQDFHDEETARLLLEAAARWTKGPGAFILDLEAGQVAVKVLEEGMVEGCEVLEVVNWRRLALEDFLR